MTFDLESLKNAAADRLRGIGDRLKRRSDDAPLLTYGALCGMSLVPLVEAAGAGQLAPVFMALGNIVGGVGANLVANQIQQWADPCGNVDEAQVARWVAEHSSNTQVIEALDAILEKLDAVEQAKSGMSQEDQDWFLNALRDETERIGNLSRYQAVLRGHGLIAQGEHIVQANNHSLAIETVNGNVTFTTIEHQVNHTLAPPDSSTERARRRYLTQLRHRCNALPLAAMGSDQDMGEDVSLDQVYIDLDTLPRIKVAEKERQAQEIEFDHDVKRSLTALEAATQSPRLVLLGEPGSGKSTFVRQLAARLATACLGEGDVFAGWDTCLLPLLIILRDLAPRLSSLALDGLAESEQQRRLTGEILDQLASDLDRLDAADLKPDLRDTLIEGKAVLILDGLDEVPEALRELVRRSVHALLHEYPRLQRVIVTCRIRSYSGATVLRNFASHTLAPFDEEKIEKFITAWYNAQVSLKRMDGTKAEERSRDLIQAALEEHLREMSSNPMLLTTMAIIHQRDVGLPRERVRLYSQATQVLLNRWQKHKGLISKELEEVLNDSLKLRAVMERLGYEAHRIQSARGNEADLTRGDILALLEAPEYLKDVKLASSFLDYCDQRAGLLVGRGSKDEAHKPREYSFPHRTFQEYLAGCHMVRGRVREIAEEYKARAAEGDFWALAAQLGTEELLYNKSRPKEALDLAYALCPDREVRGVSEWREVLWAGQIIAMLGIDALWSDQKKTGNNFEYPERLLDRLVRILEQFKLVTVERIEAGCVLARLGDPRPGVGLRSDNGLPDIVWCDVPAGLFAMGNPKEQAIYNDETPQRRIHLPAYRISRYPVTNVQFSAFVRDGGYTEKWCRCWSDAGWRENGGRLSPYNFGNQQYLPNHPVVRVSWYEAAAFCGWLTERLRQHGEIGPEQVVRLPRESEWEKAARGSDGRIYPWGEGCDAERTNYAETSINSTSTVGCFPNGASYYGVLDMAGNVWEWCATGWQRCYEDYRDDLDDAEDGRRVLRGGSFVDCDVDLRCTVRDREDPYYCGFDVGFRLVLAPI